MKKFLLTVAMITSALSMAKGTVTIGGGAGVYVPFTRNIVPKYIPTINLNSNYVLPVYEKEKLSVLVGGGADIKVTVPTTRLNRVIIATDILPYGTVQLGYKVAPETKLRFGGKIGIGTEIGYDAFVPGGFAFLPMVPAGLVFGVNWKHLSVDLEAGATIAGFKPVGGMVVTGLSIGYSF
ncbi:hypothetical protein [Oceanivirga salmonicida]|uniref:hypothetical protein n=1 Tax=Oceanivirga salmonicida TaxID=1769291 RepID=UPI00082E896D|nr:hypothetical protein [Oceanivirga salmonicida]